MKKDVCGHCLENESVRVKHEGDRGQPAQLRGDHSKRPAAAANPPPEPPSVLTNRSHLSRPLSSTGVAVPYQRGACSEAASTVWLKGWPNQEASM